MFSKMFGIINHLQAVKSLSKTKPQALVPDRCTSLIIKNGLQAQNTV